MASPDSISAVSASGIEAADVLPDLDDVAGDDGVLAEAEPLGHRLDDAQVGLVRGEDVDVGGADPGLLHRLDRGSR